MEFDAVLIEPRLKTMKENGLWQDLTADDYLDICLKNDPDGVAVTDYSVATGLRQDITWAELDLLGDRAAIGLKKLGVGANDVVTCQLPNGWQFIATFLGCSRIGAVFNPVMHIFRERELSFMLKHGESKVFVVPKLFNKFDHEKMADGLCASLPDLKHIVVLGGSGENDFDSLLSNPTFDAERKTLLRSDRLGPNDVCQLIYTSGTTGEPKGAMHTCNTMYANLKPFAERLAMNSKDVILMFSPMAHQTGFMYGWLLPLMLQAKMVLMDSWNKEIAANLISSESVTWTMASTPFLVDLTSTVEQLGTNSDSLRIFLCAGTSIPGPVVEKAQYVLGARVVSAWGMTENGAVTTIKLEDDPHRAAESDGIPLPGVEIQIRDSSNNSVLPGEEGDLFLKSCSNFGGYLKRPHLNNVDSDGWFDTGDRARMDSEGYIRICGRSKDIIIRGAENIPVLEIEAVLFKHSSIKSVAIVGFPDERLGERACAFVVLNDDCNFSMEDMQSFLLQEGVAKQYWPERLEIRESLPSTASGKIQKFALREMIRQEI